jgi:ribosomal 30S subunit maturation factor RimM
MKSNFVSIGKILNFHGVKGEAKFGYTKNREDFLLKLEVVYIQKDNELQTAGAFPYYRNYNRKCR